MKLHAAFDFGLTAHLFAAVAKLAAANALPPLASTMPGDVRLPLALPLRNQR